MYSDNSAVTSKLQVSEERYKANSLLKSHKPWSPPYKIWSPEGPGARNVYTAEIDLFFSVTTLRTQCIS